MSLQRKTFLFSKKLSRNQDIPIFAMLCSVSQPRYYNKRRVFWRHIKIVFDGIKIQMNFNKHDICIGVLITKVQCLKKTLTDKETSRTFENIYQYSQTLHSCSFVFEIPFIYATPNQSYRASLFISSTFSDMTQYFVEVASMT